MASFSSYEEFSSSSGDLALGGASSGFSFSSGSSSGAALGASAGFSSFSASSSSSSASSSESAEAVADAALAASLARAVAASGGAAAASYVSQIEQAILRSSGQPIAINETEEISVLGQRGIFANKAEVSAWRGAAAIGSYNINQDSNPEIITKSAGQSVEYVQELAVRYLRPPTPPTPGEIIIIQEPNVQLGPAPPLVIRQQPARPSTPAPLVIREAPPQAPGAVGRKLITISGKRIPPPPRKVIIERLAALPSKPQSVLIERWLAYGESKRRVIFRKSNVRDAVVVTPRNVIIQWEAPRVSVRKEIKNLGVIRANPADYVQRYGASLIVSSALPAIANEFAVPNGLVLAANYKYKALHELTGDVAALALINLEANGLSAYSSYLSGLGVSASSAAQQFGLSAASASAVALGVAASSAVQYGLAASASSASSSSSSFEFSSSSSSSGGASYALGGASELVLESFEF